MFIGDGGTLVLGIVIAIFVIRTLQDGTPCERHVDRNMGLIPFTLAVLAFPVFDTLRVMCARILRGGSPFRPGQDPPAPPLHLAGILARRGPPRSS